MSHPARDAAKQGALYDVGFPLASSKAQMRRWNLNRGALSVCVAAALLASCGGSQPPIGAPASSGYGSLAKSPVHSKTFVFTGEAQSFTVPAAVRRITVVARGAGGTFYHCLSTGRGARVYASIPVASGERLSVYVGGADGFNGGGQGNRQGGSNGGGASDVRTGHGRLRDRILVAAGGGGTGGLTYCFSTGGGYGAGGSGGGFSGGPGSDGMSYGAGSPGGGGFGGTQTAGGAGGPGGNKVKFCRSAGSAGSDGALGLGGRGGVVARSGRRAYPAGGGGGGGGYFGGGGGGSACYVHAGDVGGGGGAGGSSYAEPRATNVRYWGNWKNARGNGLVVINW